LVVEFPATGGMFNSWSVRTSKLLRYVSSLDFAVAAMEILFILFTIYYTLEEVVDIGFSGCRYFKDPYNFIDWFILGLSYVTIGLSLYRTIQVNILLDSLLSDTTQFQNFDTLTYCQELFNQASAIMIFFAWVKIFKYISLNRTLDQLSSTLKRSAKDILYFIVIFFIVFFAYGALATCSSARPFRTIRTFSRRSSRCSVCCSAISTLSRCARFSRSWARCTF
jgi:hypothetical protein